jgi:hypothetical protein
VFLVVSPSQSQGLFSSNLRVLTDAKRCVSGILVVAISNPVI